MKLSKIELTELIKEVIKENNNSFLLEQPNSGQKELLKANAIKHINLLKYMKEVLKDPDPQQIKNMVEQIKKAQTSVFLKQVLNVKDSIPVNLEAVLENPLELLQSLVDEIINISVKNAKQKLMETKEIVKEEEFIEELDGENLPFLARDYERLEKHKQKEKKRKEKEAKQKEKENKKEVKNDG